MARFVKNNILPIVACTTALISMIFVPPNAAYLDYIDWRTLACLFCISASVNALESAGAFKQIAARFAQSFKTRRVCVAGLMLITLIAAMFITNDMALLTFLPLSYLVLRKVVDDSRTLAWCFVLQNAAAVLGGMILPFGNPHNLFLYNLHEIAFGDFILTMLPTFCTAVVLIGLCCLFVKNEPLISHEGESTNLRVNSTGEDSTPRITTNKKLLFSPKLFVYIVLFLLTLASVLRFIPYYICIIIVAIAVLICDRRILLKVDYGLLITFAAFFIFSGNLTNIAEVKDFIIGMLAQNELISTVATCQVISNLPTTLLLAPFTENWPTLLVATDIGGMGTPIASLASLITIRMFLKYRPNAGSRFFKYFLSVGFGFLIILCVIAWFTLPY